MAVAALERPLAHLTFATLALALVAPAAAQHPKEPIAATVESLGEGDLLPHSWTLLSAAGFGFRETERAGWIVRGPRGEGRLVLWPAGHGRRKERFSGLVPKDASAVLHTHPNAASPEPSDADEAAARAVGIPVCAVSRYAIVCVRPDGRRERLAGDGWERACRIEGCRALAGAG